MLAWIHDNRHDTPAIDRINKAIFRYTSRFIQERVQDKASRGLKPDQHMNARGEVIDREGNVIGQAIRGIDGRYVYRPGARV